MSPVRQARPEDLPAILAIESEVIERSHANFHTEPRSLEALEAEWARDHARYPWLVLEQDGRVVGYARGSGYKPRAAYAGTAEVTVYLEPDARGRGWSRVLHGALIERLREAGFHLALAGIALPNDASVALHEGLGFERAGLLPEVGWRSGAWRDVALYTLRLS